MRFLPFAALLVAPACAPQPSLVPIAPERRLVEGDVNEFGPGPIAVDDMLLTVEFQLDRPATVVIYTFDPQYRLRMVDRRRLTAGTHRFPTRRAGSPNRTELRGAWDALLFIAADEHDWQSTGTVLTIPPNEALRRLPPTLMRHGSSHWASYLVVP